MVRGWPKPKSSGLNQEPTKKKASRLGTWFWEFSSSWYPVRYPFADFLVRPGTSGLKFLVQPGSSWINQEVLGSTRKILPFPRPFLFFIRKFLVMGPFSTTRNGPWSKNAESCLKISNNNYFFIGSCSLHVDHILLTTPNPFKENNYSVRELRKGFKMEFPWMWVGPISILWDLNFVKIYI